MHSRLLHPFAQADEQVSAKYGGTGLGLWISAQIVEMMKGTLRFESEEGAGTTFRVRVPLNLPQSLYRHFGEKVEAEKSAFLRKNGILVKTEDSMHR